MKKRKHFNLRKTALETQYELHKFEKVTCQFTEVMQDFSDNTLEAFRVLRKRIDELDNRLYKLEIALIISLGVIAVLFIVVFSLLLR